MLDGCSGLLPEVHRAVAFSHDIKHAQRSVSTAITTTSAGTLWIWFRTDCNVSISGTDVFDGRELTRRYLNLIGPLNFGAPCTRKVPEVKPQFMHCLLFVNTRGQT